MFTRDIEKMFLQVNAAENNQDFQRNFWREEVKLNTVTYGIASAMYLSICAMQHLIKDKGETLSTTKEVLKQDFYVDWSRH